MPAKPIYTPEEMQERRKAQQQAYRSRLSLKNKAIDLDEPEQLTPLAFMLKVMNDPNQPASRRDRMALAAAPYIHLNLSKAAAERKPLKKEQADIAATEAHQGKFASAPMPRLIVNNNKAPIDDRDI